MACTPCAKRAADRAAARNTEYVWTSADGTEQVVYSTEIVAKAKVTRVGGSYAPRTKPR